LLQVSDTGSGIPESVIAKIFDPFFTIKPLGSGTGLGLSIIAGIIRVHGGEIKVNSIIGKGTTFSIYFPDSIPQTSELVAISEDGRFDNAIAPSSQK
jgi:signal transduction histidine kinase